MKTLHSPLEEFKVLPVVRIPLLGDVALTNIIFSAFLVFLFTIGLAVSLS
jgi:hypothetical protein